MKTVKAILISDIHYNMKNLELSDISLQETVKAANECNAPLIICGDLHDTKANLRAECIERIINTLQGCATKPYILVGNHDLVNERGTNNALSFLEPLAHLIAEPCYNEKLNTWLFPYYSDVSKLLSFINKYCTTDKLLIMHQGMKSASMGDYIQDHSAMEYNDIKQFTCFSGHYHKHQSIGGFTYVGNPFTMSFGEAEDGAKGYLKLYADNSFSQIKLKLRKHIVIQADADEYIFNAKTPHVINSNDLVWVKLTGSAEKLNLIKKDELGLNWNLPEGFKLDKTAKIVDNIEMDIPKDLKDGELLDMLIDAYDTTSETKNIIKNWWKFYETA